MLETASEKLRGLADPLRDRDQLVVRRAELLKQVNDEMLRMRGLELAIKSVDGKINKLNRRGLCPALARLLSRRRRAAILSAERSRAEAQARLEEVRAGYPDIQERLRKAVAALRSFEHTRTQFETLAGQRLEELRARGARTDDLAAMARELEATSAELIHLDRAYFAGAEAMKLLKELARSLAATGQELVNLRGRGLIHVMLQAASGVHNGVVNRQNADPLQQVEDALTEFDGRMRAVRWNTAQSCDRGACEAMAELSLTRKRLGACAKQAAGKPQLAAMLARHLQTAMNHIGVKRLELARHAAEVGATYRRTLVDEPVAQSAV